jgi:hypothetical protein
MNAQCTIYVNCPKKTLKRKLAQAKEDYPNQVHSDQMVLGRVRGVAGPCEKWPKTL